MPHVLALEWDDAEARMAVADVRRGSIVLEQAFSVALPGSLASGESAAGPVSSSGAHDLGAIGRRIGEALTARGIRRGKTLIAVGRANIELKNLTVPPSPPDELPELVRFQAEREFNALADDWPLDFVPIPGNPDEPQNVLAAAISPELVAEIEVTCEVAHLTPQRLILRPCAAASLLSRVRPGNEQKLRLLIDLLAEEADLTVLAGDAVVFLRTARLPHDLLQSDPLRALLPEVRRTIAAVHNRFHGQHIEEVFLCGEASSQGGMAREMGRELELPTEVFNPLTSCPLGGELRHKLPEHPSRYAPLVGMLLHEAEEGTGIIDFLNPRRKPEARNRRREITIAAAAIGLLLAVGFAWIWSQLSNLDSEIARLRTQAKSMEEPVKAADSTIGKAQEIEAWLASDVNWLDVFAQLAEKAPSAQDLMLTRIHTTPDIAGRSAESKLELQGVVRNMDVVDKLYQSLRDSRHEVVPKGSNRDSKHPGYERSFTAEVMVTTDREDVSKEAKAGPVAKGVKGRPPVGAPKSKAGPASK